MIRCRWMAVPLRLGSVFLASCASGQMPSTQSPAVYEQTIRAIFREDVDVDQPRAIFVFKKSGTLDPHHIPDSSYQSRFRDSTGVRLVWGTIPASLRQSFAEIVTHSVDLRESALPPAAQQREARDTGGITLALSPIAFGPDSTQALAYVEVHCGGVCGGADIVYLRKTLAGWVVAATFPIWRS